MKQQSAGFSLVELIIFIVLIAIVMSIFIPLNLISRDVHHINQQTQAIALAQQRMELILEQYRAVGFDSFSDSCSGGSPPSVCNVPSDYTINATIANDWNSNTNYKVITVEVSGKGNTTLKTLVAKYL